MHIIVLLLGPRSGQQLVYVFTGCKQMLEMRLFIGQYHNDGELRVKVVAEVLSDNVLQLQRRPSCFQN